MESKRQDTERATIPVAREDIEVTRAEIETGVVRVRKIVDERVQHVDEVALRDDVSVERIAIGREVDEPAGPRDEAGVLVIPVYEEIVKVERRWILKEELRVSKRRREVPVTEDVVLRQERAVVERTTSNEK
jgi:uncharacterized protein (TIGR02271 family)